MKSLPQYIWHKSLFQLIFIHKNFDKPDPRSFGILFLERKVACEQLPNHPNNNEEKPSLSISIALITKKAEWRL